MRMTMATRETLANKARAAGVSEGEFIRRYIDGVPNVRTASVSADPALIAALNNLAVQMSRSGNNVNQLSAATHMGRDFTKYWREIGAELEGDLMQARSVLNRALEAMDQ